MIKPRENQTGKKNKTKNHRDELISITKKISTYTKEFITNFCDRNENKQEREKNYRKKIPIAKEYLNNKGQVCLQLRLVDSTESVQLKINRESQDRAQNIKTIFSNRNQTTEDNWSTQTSSLYNYLTTGKKKDKHYRSAN